MVRLSATNLAIKSKSRKCLGQKNYLKKSSGINGKISIAGDARRYGIRTGARRQQSKEKDKAEMIEN